MTSSLEIEDFFMPFHQLPETLKKLAKKRPVPFSATESLLEQFKKLKTMDKDHGGKLENTYYGYFRLFFKQLERIPKGYERGVAVHHAMDRVIKETAGSLPEGTSISCTRGCNHCCHMRVSVAASEADVLISHIKKLGLRLDRDRAKLQIGQKSSEFSLLGWDKQRCLLLGKNGDCQVYQWRPTACRKYAVVSEPEMCDGRKHPTAHIVSDIRCEALTAALYSLEEPFGFKDAGLAERLMKLIPETSNLWRKNETGTSDS